LKRWNEFLTKDSAKTWQKLWDLGVQMAITITSLMTESMLDRHAQGLFNALLVSRKNRVLSEIQWIILKSLFGEAAEKSDCARSEFVYAVGKTSTSAID
jgi:hypothetical protein